MDVVHAVCNASRDAENVADLQLARSLPETMAVRYWDEKTSAWQWAKGIKRRREEEDVSMVLCLFDPGRVFNVDAHGMLWYLAHCHAPSPPAAPPILLVPLAASAAGCRADRYHVHACDFRTYASSADLSATVQALWRSFQENGHLRPRVCVVCSEAPDDRLLQHLAARKHIFHRVHRTPPLPRGPYDYYLVDLTSSPSGHPPTRDELLQRITDITERQKQRKHLFYSIGEPRPAALAAVAERKGWRSYALPLDDETTCFCVQQPHPQPRPAPRFPWSKS